MAQKKEEASDEFAASNLPKKPDGTLQMPSFYDLIPHGQCRREMRRFCDLDILFGKLKYNSHFNRTSESEFLRGTFSEKMHSFQASPLQIVWGDDPADNQISAYRIISLLILSRFAMKLHKSCEETPQPTFVMTDIHGQFGDLLRWFFKIGGPEQRSKFYYVCTGDMVDRGLHQIETVCLFLYYKLRYPTRFYLLRGNHEDYDLHETYGFLAQCKDRFIANATEERHKKLANNIWFMFIHVFNYMPSVSIIEKKFMCVHGGISPLLSYCATCKANNQFHKLLDICQLHKTSLSVDQLIALINSRVRTPIQVGNNYVQPGDVQDKLAKMENPAEYTCLFSDLIWSDPKTCDGKVDHKDASWQALRGWSENRQRQISFEFGTDVIEKFVTQFSLCTIIRGHEPKVRGFEWHYMKRCITVFSAPNYSKSNDAAIAMITQKEDESSRKLRLDPITLSKIEG